MADYHPLIARAVEGLSDRSPEMRRAVYERARTALLGQLRSLDPPLSEADIERETISLDDAIRRVEESYVAEAAPAAAFPDMEPTEPMEPQAPPARFQPPLPAPPREPEPDDDEPAYEEVAPAASRPRIDSLSPTPKSKDSSKTIMLGVVVAVVVAAIAVAAWFLRDRPDSLPAEASVANTQQAPAPDNGKFSERVGGPAPNANAAQARQDLGVAQRAVFYEEDPANSSGPPKAHTGRIVWRLDTVNAGQGQALETVVRGTIEIPDVNMNLNLLLRKNLDATLPASHTVELNFTTPAGDTGKVVRDIGLLQFKNEEAARGTPIAGLPVPVRENYFLIGMSNLSSDIERNVELFVRRNWIDLPLRLANGQRAILSFEKGSTGEQVMTDAFRQWQ